MIELLVHFATLWASNSSGFDRYRITATNVFERPFGLGLNIIAYVSTIRYHYRLQNISFITCYRLLIL